jgi:immune inhibitor A
MQKEKKLPIGWLGLGLLGTLAVCFCLVAPLVITILFFPSGLESTPGFRDATSTSQEATPTSETSLDTIDILSNVEVPIADLPAIAERLLNIEDVPRILALDAEPIPIGTKQDFWVLDTNINQSQLIEARLEYAGEIVYFWVDTRVEVNLGDIERIVERFEEETYPSVRSLIGSEWNPGVDGDPHLYMLYAKGLGASVAGLFWPNDEYSPMVHEYSNGHEMFYLNADGVSLGSGYIESVLAHEFQHMVHWHIDRNEETWLNEGFSELVELVLGFEIGGFDYLYSQNTDQQLTRWPSEPGAAGEHYGQVFLFSTYLFDRFGREVIGAIAANTADGLTGIDRTLAAENIKDPFSGDRITADDVFLDWAVSLALQDPGLADGRYGLQSYTNAPIPRFNDIFDRCPTSLQKRTVNQYGIDLVKIKCHGDYRLRFTGQTTTKVVSGDPHSGEYAFWSNEGDEADMTLTRAFDFTEVSGPILLEYWVWYEIEHDYDYVYLEISADAEKTWQILQTPSGTGDDPSGNAFGWGYTGVSGNGAQPIWIKESLDLSSYAGKEITLRFEYITDTAVCTEGFLLDDLSISAIGYSEDFEDGEGNWQAEGFVRLSNQIPQTYRLAIIERGPEISVREIELNSDNQAEILLPSDDSIDDIILVVTATSRFSWLPANYQFEIIP